MSATLAMQMSKWTLDLASRLIRARVRLHNIDVVEPDMAIIFTANHFTRLETLLLPYLIHTHTGLEPWSLATHELFQGRIGRYLRDVGAISTQDPDRDKTIIRAMLCGDHPWIIFPEGAMIKDKKVISADGTFQIFNGIQHRPPHSGAAALALRAAYYRAKLRCLHEQGDADTLSRALAQFNLDSIEDVVSRRTVVIPVNITYYPIRARDNIFLRAARRIAGDLNKRIQDELSVEGTVLAENTDIDVAFGEPINTDEYLASSEFSSVMACGLNDFEALSTNPREAFQDAAKQITTRYMSAIYSMTRVNIDHIFAEIIRRQPEGRRYSKRDYRERIYLGAVQLLQGDCHTHPDLEEQIRTLLDDEPHVPFDDFLDMAVREKFLAKTAWGYKKSPRKLMPVVEFHAMPREATPDVIANELEAARPATAAVRRVAWAPDFLVKTALRTRLMRHNMQEFEEAYARYYAPGQCKPPWVGRPFLLRPWRIRGGIVLAHGYMAAPLEVRMLAEHLYRRGFAVYGVRLKGHGTAPEDLARSTWEEWYASFNQGYAVMRTLTENVFLGGFSTGGCLAMLGAARKHQQIKGVFSICAPLYVRNYSIRLVPSIISLNTLLKRIGQSQYAWEYVENNPENKHINYTRNPLTGVRQLTMVMNATADSLHEVAVPTLVIQASKDTTVDPTSGPLIFEKLGAKDKQLVLFERERHGIVNGEGSRDVFEEVEHFLERVIKQARSRKYWLLGRRLGEVLTGKVIGSSASGLKETAATSAVDAPPHSVL